MVNLYVLGKKGLIALSKLDMLYRKNIKSVIIGSDKNIDNDFSSEIIKVCQDFKLNYQFQNHTSEYTAKYSVAIGWRWLINDDSNLIVFHDSILPHYRGFNPLVTALINGDSEIGVTALKGSKEYDKGEIIEQKIVPVTYPLKIEKAIDLISTQYANLLNSIFNKLIKDNLKSYPQDSSKVSYSLWRDEDDYKIDWSLDALKIKRFIDAVGFPYKGAYTIYNGKKLIIKNAEIVADVNIANRTPGKVIFKENNSYTIVCGKGLLKIKSFYDSNNMEVRLNKFRLRLK
ncbi:formyltransferase family protein [Psychroflexus sp. ALD_RP9]|uniref:formyltransferase family protein n=1 Tax=Psychroflexus sp. ALD_RP9 TaxID=2777186 RepID=UPI001A8F5016|nr:formyltransferase family protein [Psychroflexus sp. ALD_RP9]QSS98030.1 methionyl-tRNA formyltransferase [Psychroflexus sp. ALD_RP9]